MATFDRDTLEAALVGYEHAKKEIEAKIEQLRAHLGGHSVAAAASAPTGRRVVSAAGRKRMAAAQKKRWAAKRAEVTGAVVAPKAATKKASVSKRKPMSPEARERIAEAQRKRWAASKKVAKSK